MIILIAGATHTGKTKLAQTILEKYNYPYLCIDHLKMGLIRSKNTTLTPKDDDKLTEYLWNIIKEMIKTAIENKQNLIIEGAYIPFDWKNSFSDKYLKEIKYVCLIMTKNYIEKHFDDILLYANVIEKRIDDNDISPTFLVKENERNLQQCKKYNLNYVLIDDKYDLKDIEKFLNLNNIVIKDLVKLLETNSIDQILDNFSEGSIELRKLLNYLWDNGISTGACCSGIGENHSQANNAQPYILIYLDGWEHSEVLSCIEKFSENKDIYISHCSPVKKGEIRAWISIFLNDINVSKDESDEFFHKIYLIIRESIHAQKNEPYENSKSKFYNNFRIPAVREFSKILMKKLILEKKFNDSEIKQKQIVTPILNFNLFCNYNNKIRLYRDEDLKKNASVSFYIQRNNKWKYYEIFFNLNDRSDRIKIEKWLHIYEIYLKNIHQ